MSRPSDPRLLVLHGLRLAGAAEPRDVADAVGLPVDDVRARLGPLEAEGLVTHRTAPPAGWLLTPSGREEHARLVQAEARETGARPAIERAYDRFRALNPAVLDACSRWQVREVAGRTVRNDHGDPDHDAAVVSDLVRLHRRAEPVLDELAAALDRYRPYGPRLRRALDRVLAGEREWFTAPSIPSYHTVWFELHEDLLTTLGRSRSAEVSEAVP
ncbi:MAG TPA: hypothetical protein VKZ72_10520 [Acidimicrobiales bacterium]|jgi:DNA-binding GntR family transcriptional regulator|nr:hypothetical protein [Acidimicrobiales bacterium]